MTFPSLHIHVSARTVLSLLLKGALAILAWVTLHGNLAFAAPTAPGVAQSADWKGDHYVSGDFTLTTTGSTDSQYPISYYKLCRSLDANLGETRGCEWWVTSNNGLSKSYLLTGTEKPSYNKQRYYFWVAVNTAGQEAWSAGQYVRDMALDTVSPTTPGAATTTWAGDHYVKGDFTLTTSGSTDSGSGVASYRLCRSSDATGAEWRGCEAWVSLNSGTSYTVTGADRPSDGKSRWYYFYAVDHKGNLSGNSTGVYVRMDTTVPIEDSLTVSSSIWKTDGTGTYDIVLKASDASSGIENMRGVINLTGSNSANRRGYFSWSANSFLWSGTDSTDQVNCTGGGKAEKYNGASNSGYGKEYTSLIGCTTSVSGNQRIVTLTVKPAATFGDFGAINDISFYASDAVGNAAAWTNFDTNFLSDGTKPSNASLTISSANWRVGGSSTYDIVVKATDGGSGMTAGNAEVAALINWQGTNTANRRGLFLWDATSFAGTLDQIECTGGGKASKHSDASYTPDSITLTGCTTSVSGNERTVTFTVRPNASFGEFGAINDISQRSRDEAGNQSSWKNYDLNFSSYKLVDSGSCTFDPSVESNTARGLLVTWNEACGAVFANYLTEVGLPTDATITALKASPANFSSVVSSLALPSQTIVADSVLASQGQIQQKLRKKIEEYMCNSKFTSSYDKTQILQNYRLNSSPFNITTLTCS